MLEVSVRKLYCRNMPLYMYSGMLHTEVAKQCKLCIWYSLLEVLASVRICHVRICQMCVYVFVENRIHKLR